MLNFSFSSTQTTNSALFLYRILNFTPILESCCSHAPLIVHSTLTLTPNVLIHEMDPIRISITAITCHMMNRSSCRYSISRSQTSAPEPHLSSHASTSTPTVSCHEASWALLILIIFNIMTTFQEWVVKHSFSRMLVRSRVVISMSMVQVDRILSTAITQRRWRYFVPRWCTKRQPWRLSI